MQKKSAEKIYIDFKMICLFIFVTRQIQSLSTIVLNDDIKLYSLIKLVEHKYYETHNFVF